MPPVARRPFRAFMLAALLFGMGLAGLPSVAQQRVGVNSAVNPDATGIPPGAAPRRLVLGQEVVFNERITTGPEGQTQVLFVDQSTMTVGPRSDMVIDEFVYDPNSGTGKLAASLTRGVFRFVGGKLSKQDNAVTMQTPSATIGIRGGLILVDLSPDGQLQVIFGYGAGVTVTGLNGLAQTITRPGFQVTVAGRGAAPSTPSPTPPGAAAALLAQLDGRPGGNGGARTIPTDATVANCFFFQAEDGIRDGTVTGVQTCALPIWWRRELVKVPYGPSMATRVPGRRRRSEERRVGKECRSRWWPGHLNTKE